MTDLIFKSVLVCNDIRREGTGKYIAIGIYGPDIVIPSGEAQVSISCLLQVEARKPGTFQIDFRFGESRERNPAIANGVFQTAFAANNLLIAIDMGQPTVRAGAELNFAARVTGKRWQRLSSLIVRGPKEQAEIEEQIQAFERERGSALSRLH